MSGPNTMDVKGLEEAGVVQFLFLQLTGTLQFAVHFETLPLIPQML